MLWGGCCVDSCSAAGPLGTALWRCIFGWLLAMPKLYHHYGPQGRRSWPQDGSNTAVRQPTWRLFFARAWLWLSCRATEQSALEVHFWMIFRYVVLAGPLGRAFWRSFLCFGVVAALILAWLQGHWGQRFGGVFLDGFWQCRSCITIMGPKVDEVGPKMAPTQP